MKTDMAFRLALYPLAVAMALLAWATFPHSAHAADLVLSGWGTSAVNGTYTEGGVVNGFPSWSNGSSYLCHYNTSHAWAIRNGLTCNDGDPSTVYYYTDNDDSSPVYVSGWVVNSGDSPTGTIEESDAPPTATSTPAEATPEDKAMLLMTMIAFFGVCMWGAYGLTRTFV